MHVNNQDNTIVGVGFQNPMTAAGDMIVGGSGGAPTRLALGAHGRVLASQGGTLAYADVAALLMPEAPSLYLTAQAGVNTGSADVWTSQTTTPYVLRQATASRRPVYTTHQGVPCLDFDGTDDFLQSDAAAAFDMDGLTSLSLVVLVSCDSTDMRAPFSIPETGPYGKTSVEAGQGGGTGGLGVGNGSGGVSASFTSQGVNWFALTFLAGGASRSLSLNKTTVASGTADPTVGVNSADYCHLGLKDTSYFNGRIAELLVYRRNIGTAGRNQLIDAFNIRYGLSLT